MLAAGLALLNTQADAVKMPGKDCLHRFCHQCGKFEPLTNFDGVRRYVCVSVALLLLVASLVVDQCWYTAQLAVTNAPASPAMCVCS